MRECIRVAEWNIESGGFDGYTYDVKANPVRLPLLKEGIHRLAADFIGLVDTFRWMEYKAKKLKEWFGYSHASIVPLRDKHLGKLGEGIGIGILTNLPVKQVRTIRLYNRNALAATVDVHGKYIDIVTLYLHHASEETRMLEIQSLRRHLQAGRPTLLMGDFNTMKKEELEKSRRMVASLIKEDPMRKEKLWPKLINLRKTKVIDFVEAHGFTDAATIPLCTVPTPRIASMKQPLLRLDYVFYTKGLTVSSPEVPRGKLFQQASDHFPILCEVS